LISQVLAALSWIIIAFVFSPIVWLLFQPYLKSLSRAERRAADLLRDILTPEQFRQLLWRVYLEISSPTSPQRVYRVPKNRGYVQVIENGQAIMRLCLQPAERLPDADVVVLHKLMIEANEELYLQRANKYCYIE